MELIAKWNTSIKEISEENWNNLLGNVNLPFYHWNWLNQLERGYEDRGEILMGFSESLENQAIFSNETSIF